MTELGKQLPHDLEAERAVLSACIVDPNAFGRVVDFILPEHFHSGSHQSIAKALAALWTARTPIDVVTVASHLKDASQLNLVGGMGYLTDVLLGSPAVANVRAHAAIVHSAWRKRQVHRLCALASDAIENGKTTDFDAFLSKLVTSVTKLAQDRPDRPVVTNGALCEQYIRDVAAGLNRAKDGLRPRAIPTGLECFDRHVGGLLLGSKTTVVALSGVGKTHFAVQSLVSAGKMGIGALVYSTELKDEEFAGREIAHVARVDAKKLEMTKAGIPQLMPGDISRIMTTGTDYRTYPIVIDDRSTINIDEICADVRQWVERFHSVYGVPLGMVCIDYIQRLTAPPHMLRAEKNKQVSYATVQFTKLMKETGLAGLELAQQATPLRGTANAKPDLYDVADDKTIVKEAQSVLYLYRPYEKDPTRVNAFLAKLRGGESIEWALSLDGSQSRFTEVED